MLVNSSSGPAAGHSLFVEVAIALVTHAGRVLSAAFHYHFLGGAGAAYQPATAATVMTPVELRRVIGKRKGSREEKVRWLDL